MAARETRAVVLEDGTLQELYVEYDGARGLVGNLYSGKVTRIIPGMQAAFVDIGLAKNAFLPIAGMSRIAASSEGRPARQKQAIEQLLHEGQRLMVQVDMDPRGDKGARLTNKISIPSKYLVYRPNGVSNGVSNKIQDRQQRERLSSWLEAERQNMPLTGGFIVRTEAELASDEDLRRDLQLLQTIWQGIQSAERELRANGQIYRDIPLSLRLLRDSGEAAEIKFITDSQENYAQAQELASNFVSDCEPLIELYRGPQPLFSKYELEQEIEDVLQRKVALPSGGEIVIDYTEALTVIDVNTSSYIGQTAVLQTNLEAAVEIARQLRLRNLGGIIVVDFIDMSDPHNKQQIVDVLQRAFKSDSVATSVANVSPLGLVEITRHQKHASLPQRKCQPCDTCNGSGLVENAMSVCFKLLRELQRQDLQFQAQAYTIVAAPDVIELLEHEETASLAELQSTINGAITLQQEAHFSLGHYEIVLG